MRRLIPLAVIAVAFLALAGCTRSTTVSGGGVTCTGPKYVILDGKSTYVEKACWAQPSGAGWVLLPDGDSPFAYIHGNVADEPGWKGTP
jgi:hypothetical protein